MATRTASSRELLIYRQLHTAAGTFDVNVHSLTPFGLGRKECVVGRYNALIIRTIYDGLMACGNNDRVGLHLI